MDDFADRAYDAQSVIGPVVSEIVERLAEASSFQERIQVATDFLLRGMGGNPMPSPRPPIGCSWSIARFA
jgi:hypothetical protein